MKAYKEPKHYTEKEIISKYDKLDDNKKIKILTKAVNYVIDYRAGTFEYAVANAMGYKYEDDGSYTKPK